MFSNPEIKFYPVIYKEANLQTHSTEIHINIISSEYMGSNVVSTLGMGCIRWPKWDLRVITSLIMLYIILNKEVNVCYIDAFCDDFCIQ